MTRRKTYYSAVSDLGEAQHFTRISKLRNYMRSEKKKFPDTEFTVFRMRYKRKHLSRLFVNRFEEIQVKF